MLGGSRVTVRRPRVRRDGAEVTLLSWDELLSEDALCERTVRQMVIGVSTRSYECLWRRHLASWLHGASKSAAKPVAS